MFCFFAKINSPPTRVGLVQFSDLAPRDDPNQFQVHPPKHEEQRFQLVRKAASGCFDLNNPQRNIVRELLSDTPLLSASHHFPIL
jgi:hypothetical protein